MNVKCPKCKTLLSASQINAATDIAHCTNCNLIHRLSNLVALELEDAKRVMPEQTAIITEQPEAGRVRINSGVRGFRASDLRFFPLLVIPLIFLFQFGLDKSWILTVLLIVWLLIGAHVLISNWVEAQEFEVSESGVIYRRMGLLHTTEQVIAFNEIGAVAIEPYDAPVFGFITHAALSMRMNRSAEPVPVLKTRAGNIYFFDYVSKAEQEWIVELLKQEIYKAKSAAGNYKAVQ